MSDKCLGCGVELEPDWENMYTCGSVMIPEGGNIKPGLEQSGRCYQRQRDQLRAEVERLKLEVEKSYRAGWYDAYSRHGLSNQGWEDQVNHDFRNYQQRSMK